MGRDVAFAQEPSQKLALISQPINLEYLSDLKTIEDLDSKELTPDEKFFYNKTTPIALAVSLDELNRVTQFLKAIPDVNDPSLTGWGYRQPYTLAHMALDPQYPKAAGDISLSTRLAIIDMLGEKRADFNAIIRADLEGVYENPPLLVGDLSGRPFKFMSELRARALLYGGDPKIIGSSGGLGFVRGWSYKLDSDTCLDYYIEKMRAGATVYPVVDVMDRLNKVAGEKGINLTLLLENINSLHQNKDKIQLQMDCRAGEIAKLKLQKTKKAKRKIQHLQTIQSEDMKEISRLNRRLKHL